VEYTPRVRLKRKLIKPILLRSQEISTLDITRAIQEQTICLKPAAVSSKLN
jgi:hypothetical protein